MLVKRTISKEVDRCFDCPWFNYHPHEPTCGLKEKLGIKFPDSLCEIQKIDKECPLVR